MAKDDTPIYEIYVMSEPWHLDENRYPSAGTRERVGFYYEKETAIRAVEENWCDLQDHYAKAAEICKLVPGLYSVHSHTDYKYYLWNPDKERFEPAKKPELEGWGTHY